MKDDDTYQPSNAKQFISELEKRRRGDGGEGEGYDDDFEVSF